MPVRDLANTQSSLFIPKTFLSWSLQTTRQTGTGTTWSFVRRWEGQGLAQAQLVPCHRTPQQLVAGHVLRPPYRLRPVTILVASAQQAVEGHQPLLDTHRRQSAHTRRARSPFSRADLPHVTRKVHLHQQQFVVYVLVVHKNFETVQGARARKEVRVQHVRVGTVHICVRGPQTDVRVAAKCAQCSVCVRQHQLIKGPVGLHCFHFFPVYVRSRKPTTHDLHRPFARFHMFQVHCHCNDNQP